MGSADDYAWERVDMVDPHGSSDHELVRANRLGYDFDLSDDDTEVGPPWVSSPDAPSWRDHGPVPRLALSFPEMGVQSDRIWHYTSTAGAIGILESRTLWATNVQSLNDEDEFFHAMPLVKEELDRIAASRWVHPLQKQYLVDCIARIEDEADHIFVACASVDADSLSQWRGYGTGQGIAIEIALDYEAGGHRDVLQVLQDPSDPPPDLFQPSSGDLVPEWSRVIYDHSEKVDYVRRLLSYLTYRTPIAGAATSQDDYTSELAASTSYLIAGLALCKHESFRDEREVRVALRCTDARQILHRPGPYGVIPYLPSCQMLTDGDRIVNGVRYSSKEEAHLAVTQVMVGPGPHRPSRIAGMQSLLRRVRPTARATFSQAPFR